MRCCLLFFARGRARSSGISLSLSVDLDRSRDGLVVASRDAPFPLDCWTQKKIRRIQRYDVVDLGAVEADYCCIAVIGVGMVLAAGGVVGIETVFWPQCGQCARLARVERG